METNTETFFLRQNFPEPIRKLFSQTKFSETETLNLVETKTFKYLWQFLKRCTTWRFFAYPWRLIWQPFPIFMSVSASVTLMNFQPNYWVKQGQLMFRIFILNFMREQSLLTTDCLFFPLCLFWYHFFWNQDFFSGTKFSETETKTLNKLAKVSKPRSFKITLWI